MKPVMQTVTGPSGNCFSACFASIFECPIEDVPNFFNAAGDDVNAWWAAVRDWLRPRGFGIMWLQLGDPSYVAGYEGWLIVSGKSERGLDHATIWKDGRMVHDPHPSQSGILAPEGIDVLYPLNPAILSVTGAG